MSCGRVAYVKEEKGGGGEDNVRKRASRIETGGLNERGNVPGGKSTNRCFMGGKKEKTAFSAFSMLCYAMPCHKSHMSKSPWRCSPCLGPPHSPLRKKGEYIHKNKKRENKKNVCNCFLFAPKAQKKKGH